MFGFLGTAADGCSGGTILIGTLSTITLSASSRKIQSKYHAVVSAETGAGWCLVHGTAQCVCGILRRNVVFLSRAGLYGMKQWRHSTARQSHVVPRKMPTVVCCKLYSYGTTRKWQARISRAIAACIESR